MLRYIVVLFFATHILYSMDHTVVRRGSPTKWPELEASYSEDDDFDRHPKFAEPKYPSSCTKTCLRLLVTGLAIASCGGDLTSLAGIHGMQGSCSPITAYPFPSENSSYSPETGYPSLVEENPDCSYSMYRGIMHPAYARGFCPRRNDLYSCIVERCKESLSFETARNVAWTGQITALATKLPFVTYGTFKIWTWK